MRRKSASMYHQLRSGSERIQPIGPHSRRSSQRFWFGNKYSIWQYRQIKLRVTPLFTLAWKNCPLSALCSYVIDLDRYEMPKGFKRHVLFVQLKLALGCQEQRAERRHWRGRHARGEGAARQILRLFRIAGFLIAVSILLQFRRVGNEWIRGRAAEDRRPQT